MHTLDQYRGTVVACRYCPPPSLARPETLVALKARFYDAIARVVLDQTHLQVGITGVNSKDPAFVRLDRLDLRNHVDWTSFEDSNHLEPLYLQSMQTQLDSGYDHLSTRPGWRVIVLHKVGAESMEVLYVWNHPHHDGMSGKIFHQNTKSKRNGSDSWTLDLPDPSDKLPPNPEILSPWPMTPAFLLKSLWKELKPSWIFPLHSTHATWAPIQGSPFTTRFRNFMVDNDTVTKVVGACRVHRTTLTGLVQVLVLVSLTSALEDMNGFTSKTPYDLRHILPSNTPQYPCLQPKELMFATIRSKMLARAIDASLSADIMEIIWSVSARVRREIQARLDSGVRNDLIGIMKLVSDWRSQQQSEAHKMRYLSWLVNNLGEGWLLRRAELVLSAEVPSAALSVSIMTVKGGEMCITCSWQDCTVDLGLGERLMGDLKRWLNETGS
ncbi:hypothetical protein K505DRAFT_352582 [Melanomma pulvis-pyrius CBS 109.77]|uniref:Alcohol acetyltransferase n=1 Tax=Melanomma pulvis-pyrius CBS 109.77 TaxID=1314802 RepID=A0A6A6WZE4_9PLEO|nr:hypothetical protein K505DRAFT_352582 [Melanomma pulvis-pyrius CBS 109.77]